MVLNGVIAPPGHHHGAGVQGRQDLLHGPAAAPVSGQVVCHHCRPNQKGAAPSCVCFLYCRVFTTRWLALNLVLVFLSPPAGLRQSLHGHRRHQHRRATGIFHPGAVCGAELQHRNHRRQVEGRLSLSVGR